MLLWIFQTGKFLWETATLSFTSLSNAVMIEVRPGFVWCSDPLYTKCHLSKFYSYGLDYGFFTFYGILKNIRSKEIGKLRFLFPTFLIVTCNCRKKKYCAKILKKGGIEKIGDTFFFMDFYCISIVSSHFPGTVRISVRSCEGNIVKTGKIFSTENRYMRDILHRAIECKKSFPIRLLADWF